MRTFLLLALVAVLPGCAHTSEEASASASRRTPDSYQAIVNAPDRTEADRALDPGRHPAELLSFLNASPGMKMAELGAGSGYTTELLARAVGATGVVYGQNTPMLLQRFLGKPWSERLARPATMNVVRLDREFEDPFPPEVKDLDLVLSNVVYHDAAWLNVDRDKMNRAVFRALKPGGIYVVSDSSAKPGTGIDDAKTLHRIDEQVVREEIARAGFKLVEEASFLRNSADARDWNSSPMAAKEKRGTSDRFVLKFVKTR